MQTIEKAVAKSLLDIKAVMLRPEHPFTWASGWKSPIYCDNRKVLSYPEIRENVCRWMADIVKEKYPDVISIIVSGYQEFQYAQEAIRQGAAEYILKPIVPSELAAILENLESVLKQKYYKGRNKLMHRMVNDMFIEDAQMKRYFQSEKYYGAIARLNGLPTRFAERTSMEVFSDINEWMIVYGRDDHETLYLCPEEILFGNDYVENTIFKLGESWTVLKTAYTGANEDKQGGRPESSDTEITKGTETQRANDSNKTENRV